jgi:uncharacterized protein
MGLLPRDVSFFDEFEKHAAQTVAGCRAFVALTTDFGHAGPRAKEILELEERCDSITHGVVAKLHKTFITPIDRNDIYRLITKMDDVMDLVEAASERITLYGLKDTTKELQDLARILLSGAERLAEAVAALRNLKNPELILEKCVEINRLENEADALLRGTLAKLFREERDPVSIIKWKEIYELLETATDRCEDVANIIEGVVLENS